MSYFVTYYTPVWDLISCYMARRDMAFDIYAGERKDEIDYHEVVLFEYLADEFDNLPRLLEIWKQFYASPAFEPSASNELEHELLFVRDKVVKSESHKWLEPALVRLASFFSFAYRNKIKVQCAGD